jgi:hypothetical protein
MVVGTSRIKIAVPLFHGGLLAFHPCAGPAPVGGFAMTPIEGGVAKQGHRSLNANYVLSDRGDWGRGVGRRAPKKAAQSRL